jgi:hypothetical protein
MNPFLLGLVLAQAATAPSPTGAAEPAPTCASLDRSLPAALASWTIDGERLVAGHAVTLQGTAPTALPSGRPGREATIAFSVPMNGVYGIALDQRGWIDVLPVMDQGAPRPLRPVDHSHAPACSTIRKIVSFELNAGTYYSLSLSGLPNAMARVMLIAPAPPAPPAQ